MGFINMGIKYYIDISGQIQQINLDSSLGCFGDNGLRFSVYFKSSIKKELIHKYKGQIINRIEKLHCILIYYCIKDRLENIGEIEICRDANFRRIKNLLPLLFKDYNCFKFIEIVQRESNSDKSFAHRVALKTFRKKKYADVLITKEMIEDVLFKFKH